MAHRVVVTGWGVLSSIGHDANTYWQNLAQGVCGIAPAKTIPTDQLAQKVVAEVKDYDPLKYFDERGATPMDRVAQFGVVAAREAIAHSGLKLDGGLSEQTACIIGCGVGGQSTQDENYKRLYGDKAKRLHPLTIPKLMVNAPASQISMTCGLRGPAFVVASACASATHAIGLAFHMVRAGSVPVAVTGGAEACIAFGTMKGWEALRVLAPDTCRPFSRDRKGLVIGEGAAAIVIESLDHARKRSANILGEIVGFGMSADAGDLLSPDAGGMLRAINGALNDGGLAASDVQYVNAHGTGTAANDETETEALKSAFGAHAGKLVMSSNKSMIGHALGAAGALELVATLMTIKDGVVPPTINYLGPDPACDIDCVPNEARRMKVDAALSNSFAFGGLNAVLAVKRFV
ncbi:beta-ketoacyl-[acyl-carrier-protein] synthase family protein [Rhodoplanes sp. Z2-YC6860]|uniref:beta-ketoacyl-[acyl-carrier-protein] synthase family protein n=1 Tax=Rhodoplanes sp. Z2-YC6860 TaxID=674703 RepID=UPI00078BC387|nr:beta-ketoacyl-[acyl-carrier-protein] synthase family protein [Rhodoplanes sp. Z2-YC6860]AMN41940.1 3-oxoacyl-ACP synthase II [Rhodoplanes sp. Z2-YC6860]